MFNISLFGDMKLKKIKIPANYFKKKRLDKSKITQNG